MRVRGKPVSCCFTGHRPAKLPWGTDEGDERCLRLKARLREVIARAVEDGYTHFICGMAEGCDLYCAEAVLALRARRPGVTLECARPCETQSHSWPAEEQARYQDILDRCDYETMVQQRYDRFCMMRRNRYMVDHAAHILTVYNGVPQGGTAQTLQYAIRKGLLVHLISLEEKT